MRGMSGRPLRLSTAVVFGRDVAARMQGALAPRPVERFLVRYHLEAIEDSLIKRSARQPTNRQCRPTGHAGSLLWRGRGSVRRQHDGAAMAGARSADGEGSVRNARRRVEPWRYRNGACRRARIQLLGRPEGVVAEITK